MKLVFILILGCSSSLLAEERLGEDIAKALIVRQLLNLIELQTNTTLNAENTFVLCGFQDLPLSKTLEKNLNGLFIQKRPLKIINSPSREEVVACDAVFINKPRDNDLRWFVENAIPEKTLFIINGKGLAELGFQIGLYLNSSNTFDFELNPDALILARQVPKTEMLKFGKVLQSNIEKKINLMRTLITYTEWPASAGLNERETFNLCTLANKTLEIFVQYYTRGKSFNGKTLNNRYIDSATDSGHCDALFIQRAEDFDSLAPLIQRNKQALLLVGNQPGMAEKGVHYNLSPATDSEQSFEINLIAFEQSGHSPHFDLFNSGRVIEQDLPELSRALESIIQQTQWPDEKPKADSAALPIELCVLENQLLAKNLSPFLSLSTSLFNLPESKAIRIRSVEKMSTFSGCSALLSGNIDAQDLSSLYERLEDGKLLWISERPINTNNPPHFQVLVSPRKIDLKINAERLKASGFVLSPGLLSLAESSGGSAP